MESHPAAGGQRPIRQAIPKGSPEWAAGQHAESQALCDLGGAYYRRGEAGRAINAYEGALAIARGTCEASAPGSPEWMAARRCEADALGFLGSAYAGMSDPRRAIEFHEQALVIEREIGEHCSPGSPEWAAARRSEGATLNRLGLTYADLGEVARAIGAYQQALAIVRDSVLASLPGSPERVAGRSSEVEALGNLGAACLSLVEPRRAIGAYEEQLQIAREISDRQAERAAFLGLGIAHAQLGDSRRAIGYYEQHLEIVRGIRESVPPGSPEWLAARQQEGDALGNLAVAYKSLGEPQRALECYKQCYTIHREADDISEMATICHNLALLLVQQGGSDETWQAIGYYEEALAVSRDMGDRRSQEAILINMAAAYLQLGETRLTSEMCEQALTSLRTTRAASLSGSRDWKASLRKEAVALSILGSAWYHLGEAQRAIGAHEHALAIDREIGDRRAEGTDLSNLGVACAALGEQRRAIAFHEQSLAIAREMGDRRGEAADLGNLGNAFGALGDARRAIRYYEQGLAIHRDISGSAREGAVERAVARQEEGHDLSNLANVYSAQGDTRQALESYEQGLAIARKAGDLWGEAGISLNLALLLTRQKRLAEALARAERAAQLFSQLGQAQPGEQARQLVDQIRALTSPASSVKAGSGGRV